jgi:hypothetical protein
LPVPFALPVNHSPTGDFFLLDLLSGVLVTPTPMLKMLLLTFTDFSIHWLSVNTMPGIVFLPVALRYVKFFLNFILRVKTLFCP